MGAAVEISSLRVVRGKNLVLPDLTATVARGVVVGLMGPSGCGKSTLMRAIVGVQQIDSGGVRVFNEPAGSKVLRSRVGYVTQSASIYGDLSVRENLEYFASVLGEGAARIDEVVEQVDLSNYAAHRVDRLSGGQRSRVSLAAALLNAPELLVLDEPTVGLDPLLRESLWQLFRNLAEGGNTLLVSSHVMDEAARCDQILLMREGKLLADQTPQELREKTGAADMEQAFLRLIESREDGVQ